MRRIMSVLLAVLTTLSVVPQDKSNDIRMQWSGGVKVEANLSQFVVSPKEALLSYSNVGASMGGFVRLDLVKNFTIQGELLVHYKTSLVKDSVVNHVGYWGLEIPIYAIYNLRFDKGDSMNFGLGPYCEFGLNATLWTPKGSKNLYDTNRRGEIQAMGASNSGFGVIIGYETTFGLQVNATYKISITNILDANSNKAALYPMAASLGFAYRWGK